LPQGQISQLLPVAEERRLIWCRNAEQCDRIGKQCDTFQTEWFNAGTRSEDNAFELYDNQEGIAK
jgi:hypothetical protein